MIRAGCAALVAVSTLLLVPGARAQAPVRPLNASPAGLQVYDTNVENLQLKRPDGKPYAGGRKDREHPKNVCYDNGALHPEAAEFALASQPYAPDVLLIQQVDGKAPGAQHAQLDRLVADLERLFGTGYHAIVAERSPTPYRHHRATQPRGCAAKYRQTNAIVYRTSRLSYQDKSKRAWASWGRKGACVSRNGASRARNVLATFTDKLTGRSVNAVSLHWPTGTSSCPAKNARLVGETIARAHRTGLLTLAGGDTNTKAGAFDWLDAWAAGGFAPAPYVGSTVDFLFARTAAGAPATWSAATGTFDYRSTHHAVTGFVSY